METSAGTFRGAPMVLVDALTDEGVTGRSYVRTYTPVALEPLARLVGALGPLLVGGPAAPAAVERALALHFRILGPQGLTGIAAAALDMALWDALARSRGVSLVTLLGGEPAPIPAYASLRSMAPGPAAEEAGEAVARGFRAVKVKIGRGTLRDDLEAIRAVRAAIGPDAGLMVDYNQALPVSEALVRARALDEEGLEWIEEPTRADDHEGHARIAAAAATPIQLGESWWGPHEMARSIAAGASDLAMPDVQKIGGVSGWLRSAALADAAGLPVSSHAFPEVSAHLLAVTPTRHLLEHLDHAGPILQRPLEVVDGHAIVPDRPGNGLEWDEERVAALLRDR
jgi:mandelate racemase